MLLINGTPLKWFKFSDGCVQVKVPSSPSYHLEWLPTCSDDIMLFIMAMNAIENDNYHNCSYRLDCMVSIFWLPYARQDRVCAPGEAFSLQAIILLIAPLNITSLNIFDVHNVMATEFQFDMHTNRRQAISFVSVADIFKQYGFLHNFSDKIVLCAPDKGALSRVSKVQRTNMSTLLDVIQLSKKRDPSTGHIYELTLDVFSEDEYVISKVIDKDILVIDDICDGGRTFNMAAAVLKDAGCKNLFLYVTHGIFSNGLDELYDNYEHIYCHHLLYEDRFPEKENKKLTVLRRFNNEN